MTRRWSRGLATVRGGRWRLDRARFRWLQVVFAAGLCWLSAGAAASDGLEGQELAASSDLRTGITTLLSGLMAGDKAPVGEIVRVWVTEDSPTRLRVDVRYADLAGYRLRGIVLDSKLRPMRAVSVDIATLEDPHGDVAMTFDLLEGRAGSDPDSGHLLLEVLPGSRQLAVSRRWFDLRKRWGRTAGEAPEHEESGDPTETDWPESARRVEIVPVPVGLAAQLVSGPEPRPRPMSPRPTLPERATPRATVTPPAEGSSGRGTRESTRPAVRDKRSTTGGSREPVRDHRTSTSTSGSRPPVRDRRTSSGSSASSASPTQRADVAQHASSVAGKALILGLDAKTRQRDGLGPNGAQRVDLLAGWQPDSAVDVREDELVPFTQVYADINEGSGIYYFKPRSYRLSWDEADGLAFSMLYQAGKEGAAGNVLISMSLEADLDPREIEVARLLLEAQKARRALPGFESLARIPVDAEPEVRLAEDLEQLFDIPADRVRASGVSDSLGHLDVALLTDSVTKENLQLALVEGGGIAGRIKLQPSGGKVQPQLIPFSVDPTDEQTYPRVYWEAGADWQNRYPYPVRARWLHVMLLIQNRPVVYSWDLGDESVAPGSTLWIDPEPVPASVRRDALRMWVDYDLDDRCEPCNREVMAALTGGVREVTAAEIVFRALTPLADTGAAEIALEIRSRYFHPTSRTLRSQPVTVIAEDGRSYQIGPIYPGEAEAVGDPLFEYRLRLVMPDGQVIGGDRWVPGDALYQPLGQVQVEAATGATSREGR